ncbi:MAG: ABC transporter permease [Candidatus Hydrogenedentota bacterium]
MGPVELSYFDVAFSAVLVLAAGAVSLGLRLGLEGRLALASVRTVVQLLLIGYVLTWVFAIEHPLVLAPVLLIMIGAASRAAVARSARYYPGAMLRAFGTLSLCGLVTVFVAATLIVGVEPWYSPQYIIPLLGMLLGNGLNGISLCLDTLLEHLEERRGLVEMELAHGATRWEAARDVLRDSVRRGMIPIINSMMVVGLVSLPGMMTGQILSGTSPLQAVKYQIMIMFMIAATTSLGCMGTAVLVFQRLFNDRHQLRAELITRR